MVSITTAPFLYQCNKLSASARTCPLFSRVSGLLGMELCPPGSIDVNHIFVNVYNVFSGGVLLQFLGSFLKLCCLFCC